MGWNWHGIGQRIYKSSYDVRKAIGKEAIIVRKLESCCIVHRNQWLHRLWSVIGVYLVLASSVISYAQETIISPATELNLSQPDWGIGAIFKTATVVRGAASCAASSCHGGPRPAVSTPSALRGSEYPIWLESDPHAASWRTLASEQSQQILTKLGIIRNGAIAKPREYDNCLACHNTNRELSTDKLTPLIAEGVGCESCHGPSQPWYAWHYQLNGSLIEGMTEIKPLVQRAKLCVACHVGSADRDMNHDIIAAGHPALYFDMSVYHDRYPKHWRDPMMSTPDYRARLWLAGQVAMADAELELTSARASKTHAVSVWPELSLYRCTDCHVALNGALHLPSGDSREIIVSGRANPRTWNLRGIESLAFHLESRAALLLIEESKNLQELLRDKASDATKIIEVTALLRQLLAAQFYPGGDRDVVGWNRQKLRSLSRTQLAKPEVGQDWESAAQFYVGAWASGAQSESKQLSEAMHTMRRALVFPNDKQSPSFPRAAKTNHPPNLEEWRSALKQAAVGLLESDSQ
ncbi:MAG: multiheme c-type cytochrome [Pirellulaceae bacterium]|nr:multiheme c-type cytochrome [Pirellulaceae bacterium]